jgi:hypothetical protein
MHKAYYFMQEIIVRYMFVNFVYVKFYSEKNDFILM